VKPHEEKWHARGAYVQDDEGKDQFGAVVGSRTLLAAVHGTDEEKEARARFAAQAPAMARWMEENKPGCTACDSGGIHASGPCPVSKWEHILREAGVIP
jgi:hypothetical protein